MFGPGQSTQGVTRAVTSVMPPFLMACAVFSGYVVIADICFSQDGSELPPAAKYAVTVLLAIFFVLMVASFLRAWLMIQTNPGLVPLPARKVNTPTSKRGPPHPRNAEAFASGAMPSETPFDPAAACQAPDGRIEDPELGQTAIVTGMRHDDPALEVFYGMDAFVCDALGHPLYCYNCNTWKPDRAHHSGEVGRCFRKMDHYCPWVGGMVAETSFKFFFQFNFYAMLFCALCLAVSAFQLAYDLQTSINVNAKVAVVVGLSALFGLFSFMMTAAALRYIVLNTTNIDDIDSNRKRYRLAIRIPNRDIHTVIENNGIFTGLVSYPLNRNAFIPPCAHVAVPDEDETDEARDLRHSLMPDAEPRDVTNERFYAVVTTREGENPWDLGVYQNFCSVMGNGPVDWFLPMRLSPCTREWSNEGFYRFGPLIEKLRARHRLGRPDDTSEKAPLL